MIIDRLAGSSNGIEAAESAVVEIGIIPMSFRVMHFDALRNSIADTSFMYRLYRVRHHNIEIGVEFMSVAAISSTPAYTAAPSPAPTAAQAGGSSSGTSAAAAVPPAASSSTASAGAAAPAAAVSSHASAVPARNADGDYKTRNAHSAATKDGDGDYKPRTSSATTQSSSAVQAALSSLKTGG